MIDGAILQSIVSLFFVSSSLQIGISEIVVNAPLALPHIILAINHIIIDEGGDGLSDTSAQYISTFGTTRDDIDDKTEVLSIAQTRTVDVFHTLNSL